jgi:hypothetical protein
MPHSEFKIKQNDTTPSIEARLRDANDQIMNLTGATVKFSMRPRPAGTVKVDGATAVIVGDATNGRVRYDWTASNTNTADVFEAEFEVTFSNGKIQTFPGGKDFIIVTIGDDIG